MPLLKKGTLTGRGILSFLSFTAFFFRIKAGSFQVPDTLMSQVFTSSLSETLHQAEDIYPYPTIWINERHVSIAKILQEKEPPRSSFEESTFLFIRQWLSGVEH